MIKKILLVEDEVHKLEELTACLEDFYKGQVALTHVDSVHEAFWAVSTDVYDLIILDMALPTFSPEGSAALERGHDQALGGVEVLRALKQQNLRSKVVIITQYPDITIGGKRVKLSEASGVLSRRYDQDVVGSVLYKYKSPSNSTKLTALLKKAA
ncbi:response regulator [Brevundimonas sp. P7753]|uniref:response regulator n=1 Tax=Brevundimonas sp. P7753 TaxID=2726982 RepID=UPI000FB98540